MVIVDKNRQVRNFVGFKEIKIKTSGNGRGIIITREQRQICVIAN